MSKAIVNIMIGFFTFLTLCGSGQVITRTESVKSLYIEVYKDSIKLGSATGFVIKSKTQNYLITNWHVVSNMNPFTLKWIDTNVQIAPNRIVILHNAKELGNYTKRNEILTSKKGVLYKEFVVGNEIVDVVAVPLKDTSGDIQLYPVDYSNGVDSLLLEPTDRLFVLGFPRGYKSAPQLPIWKSGLIASEPQIDQEGKPIIWLDIESYGGMSGSPVYLITNTLRYRNGNSENIVGGNLTFFVGVFSHDYGHINVGGVWKNTFLRKLFQSLP